MKSLNNQIPAKRVIIHVNSHHIRWNRTHAEKKLPFVIKMGKQNIYAQNINIIGPSKLIYTPEKPLSCGAEAYIICEGEIEFE